MTYDNSKGIFGNIARLFEERNRHETAIATTNTKVDDNQADTDEMMLDHEERIILLEVGA